MVSLGCGKQSEEPARGSDRYFPPALASPGHRVALPFKLGLENTAGKELTTETLPEFVLGEMPCPFVSSRGLRCGGWVVFWQNWEWGCVVTGPQVTRGVALPLLPGTGLPFVFFFCLLCENISCSAVCSVMLGGPWTQGQRGTWHEPRHVA